MSSELQADEVQINSAWHPRFDPQSFGNQQQQLTTEARKLSAEELAERMAQVQDIRRRFL